MLKLNRSADPDSYDIYRGEQFIGFLQWHKTRSPRVTLANETIYLSIEEMEFLIREYKALKK